MSPASLLLGVGAVAKRAGRLGGRDEPHKYCSLFMRHVHATPEEASRALSHIELGTWLRSWDDDGHLYNRLACVGRVLYSAHDTF